jgi:hypothetical protein
MWIGDLSLSWHYEEKYCREQKKMVVKIML